MPQVIQLQDLRDIGAEIVSDYKDKLTFFFGAEDEKDEDGNSNYPILNLQFPELRDVDYLSGPTNGRWILTWELIDNTNLEITTTEFGDMIGRLSDQMRILMKRFVVNYRDEGSVNGKEIDFDIEGDITFNPIVKREEETIYASGIAARMTLIDRANFNTCQIDDYFS